MELHPDNIEHATLLTLKNAKAPQILKICGAFAFKDCKNGDCRLFKFCTYNAVGIGIGGFL